MISSENREKVFRGFLDLADNVKQNLFLRSMIRSSAVKRHRPKNNQKKPKANTFSFFLRQNREEIKVCKKYFMDSFQVSGQRIYHCCSPENIAALIDKRGKQRKVKPEVVAANSIIYYETEEQIKQEDRSSLFMYTDDSVQIEDDSIIELFVEELDSEKENEHNPLIAQETSKTAKSISSKNRIPKPQLRPPSQRNKRKRCQGKLKIK